MHRRSSILKFFRQLLAQEEIVVIRSARFSTLFCHTGQDQLVPDQMDWVHDLRDDHLDAPVIHMTLEIGIAEIVDPILLASAASARQEHHGFCLQVNRCPPRHRAWVYGSMTA